MWHSVSLMVFNPRQRSRRLQLLSTVRKTNNQSETWDSRSLRDEHQVFKNYREMGQSNCRKPFLCPVIWYLRHAIPLSCSHSILSIFPLTKGRRKQQLPNKVMSTVLMSIEMTQGNPNPYNRSPFLSNRPLYGIYF